MIFLRAKRLAGALLLAVLSFGDSASATPVTASQAKTAVQRWLRDDSALGCQLQSVVDEVRTCTPTNGASFHVVKLARGGFVVTSADTRRAPVVAFSSGADLVEDNTNPLWVLLKNDLAIRTQRESSGGAVRLMSASPVTVESENEAKWARLLGRGVRLMAASGIAAVSDVRVAPLVQSNWGQGKVGSGNCFNYYTPKNYVCGCVATTGAQIMRYFCYPTAAMSRYTNSKCAVEGVATTLTTQGGTYNWGQMPLVPSSSMTEEQRQAIGKLTSDVGICCNMKYDSQGSSTRGSWLTNVFTNHFGYASAMVAHWKTDQSGSVDVKRALLSNFDAGLPVALCISGDGTHEIVGDGYGYSDGTLYIHLNMGWNGLEDAWYAPPALSTTNFDFSILDGIVYNIFTNKTQKTVICSGRVLDANGMPVENAVVTATKIGTSVAAQVVTTNVKGIYALTLPASSYTVTATCGSASAAVDVTLTANVSIRLSPKGYYTSPAPKVNNVCENDIVLPGVTGVAEPKFLPQSCLVYPSTNVTISCATAGATIRYTLDGSDPTESSTPYTGAIAIDDDTVIKARAWKRGMPPSVTATSAYFYDSSQSGPKGDYFENPIVIAGANGSRTIADNSGYTVEPGEPWHTSTDDRSWDQYHTIWFKWTAPGSGTVTFTTRLQNRDWRWYSFVAVYEGDSLFTIKRIAFDDDQIDKDYIATVSFQATQGATYRIAGMSWVENQTGTFTLTWSGDLTREAPTYAVTFGAGDATGTPPDAIFGEAGFPIVLPGCGNLVKEGYLFAGWSDGTDTYAEGAMYIIAGGEDTAFVATWVPDVRHVTYDLAGGTAVTATNASYLANTVFALPAVGSVVKMGHVLVGWAIGTRTYAPGEQYTASSGSDITFTAVWQTQFVVSLTEDVPGYVSPGDTITYTIYFENKRDATSAVTKMRVNNSLSKYLDWSTFEMKTLSVGGQIDSRLNGVKAADLSATAPVKSELDQTNGQYKTRTELVFDRETGAASWFIRVVDPSKSEEEGQWPDNPDVGILQPNVIASKGEGYISYSVKVREDAPALAVIDNSASIIFDEISPIATEPVCQNVIAPESIDFVMPEVVVNEGETAKIRIRGGCAYSATSVKAYLTSNTVTAADIGLGKTKYPLAITWKKGEVGEKTLEIPIKKDKTLEADEFFTLQLAEPKGFGLGVDRVCRVTIKDPGYTALAAKVASGMATDAEMQRWAKLQKASAPYVYGLADPANAGKVVGGGLCAAGKKVTLKASENKGFVFVGWTDRSLALNGDRLKPGAIDYIATTPSLVIDRTRKPAASSATLTTLTNVTEDATFYAEFITKKEDKASVALKINGLDAVRSANVPCSGMRSTNVMCGVALNWPLSVMALSGTKIKVEGLPAGLKFTDKGVLKKGSKTEFKIQPNTIYGAPTVLSAVNKKTGAVKPSEVKVTVTTTGKSSVVYTLDIVVDPLPTWAVGNFEGSVDNGFAKMSVTAAGKVSGKIALNGTNWTFKANSFTAIEFRPEDVVDFEDAASVTTNFIITAAATAGTASREFALTLSALAVGYLPDSATALADGMFGVSEDDITEICLWRLPWTDKADKASAKFIATYAGAYSCSVTYGDMEQTATFNLDEKGVIKGTIVLPNGTKTRKVSFAADALAKEDDIYAAIFVQPSVKKGFPAISEMVKLVPHFGAPEDNVAYRAPGVFATVASLHKDTGASGTVTVSPEYGQVAVGKKVTLTAKAHKNCVFAGWYLVKASSSTPDADAQESVLPVSQSAKWSFKMMSDDVFVVAKFITMGEDKEAIKLSVDGVSCAPAISPTWSNYCGVAVNWPVVPGGLSATTVTVAGLPPGLKLVQDKTTKTYSVTGVPTEASKINQKTGLLTPSKVKFTVTTAGNSTKTFAINLVILPLPTWAVGTYRGVLRQIDRDENERIIVDADGEMHDWYDVFATVTIASDGKVSGKTCLPEGDECLFAFVSIASASEDEFIVRGNLTAYDDMRMEAELTIRNYRLRDDGDELVGTVDVQLKQVKRKENNVWIDSCATTMATDPDAPLVQSIWAKKSMPLPPSVNDITRQVDVNSNSGAYVATLKFGKSGKVSVSLFSPDNGKQALATARSTLLVLHHGNTGWECKLCVNLIITEGKDGETLVFDVLITDDGDVVCVYRGPNPIAAQ